MEPFKILVCGNINGLFREVFKRVEVIMKRKGPFECLLCVGDVFGPNKKDWKDLKAGKIKVPITTYILGPSKKEHVQFYPDSEGELVPDLIYLGKRGQLTCSTGLKIAYLSGVEGNVSTKYSFSKKDITDLTNSITDPVDILLTSQWPRDVTKFATIPEDLDSVEEGSTCIAYLAKYIKPRYHFSGLSGIWYERTPYRNHRVLMETATNCTRFIGMGSAGSSGTTKWLYAFNIIPFSSGSYSETADLDVLLTECPYSAEEYQDQFFYDINPSGSHKRSRNETAQSAKRKPKSPVTQDKCWFCMENPNFEKQLVLHRGDYNYLTLAKGPLVQEHLLIIPIDHTQSSVHMSAAEEYEVNRYKESLVKYFHDREKDVVFFERSFASPHLQIQVVPIPRSRKTFNLKEDIMKFAESVGLVLMDLSRYALVRQIVPVKKYFFYAEVWVQNMKEGRLLHVIEGKFPLQFGRMMLASEDVLDIPECVDWKECKMDPDEELKEAERFRISYKPYDHHK